MFLCVQQQWNEFIPQPHEQKSFIRQTQCASTLCWCLCTWLIWCCPLQHFQMRYFVVHFDWKSCYFYVCNNSEMNFFPQPQKQKKCRRQTQCSSTLYGCWYTGLRRCCPLQHFQMRYFVVLFDQKSCYFCVLAIKAKWILFCNHRKRKVIGHYLDVSAPPYLVLSSATLSNSTSLVHKNNIFVRNILSPDILLCSQIHFVLGLPSMLI